MRVELVPLNTIHLIWDQVEDYFQKVIDKSVGEYNIEQLKAHVVAGMQTLYIAINKEGVIKGGAIVNFINYPNFRVAFITATGGNMIINNDTLWVSNYDFMSISKFFALAYRSRVSILTCGLILMTFSFAESIFFFEMSFVL